MQQTELDRLRSILQLYVNKVLQILGNKELSLYKLALYILGLYKLGL